MDAHSAPRPSLATDAHSFVSPAVDGYPLAPCGQTRPNAKHNQSLTYSDSLVASLTSERARQLCCDFLKQHPQKCFISALSADINNLFFALVQTRPIANQNQSHILATPHFGIVHSVKERTTCCARHRCRSARQREAVCDPAGRVVQHCCYQRHRLLGHITVIRR